MVPARHFMAEANPQNAASSWLHRREASSPGPGRSHLFMAVEAALEPVVLLLTLWGLAWRFEGSLQPAYLILSVLVFSLTFPGSSQLSFSAWRMVFNIVFNWFWIAGLLLLTGFATDYIYKFSGAAISNWLWLAPLAQIGAHLALRVGASQLLKLQGPPQRAVIVGMNDQGVSLANSVPTTLPEGRFSSTPASLMTMSCGVIAIRSRATCGSWSVGRTPRNSALMWTAS